jgi:hypothetical protein
MLYAPVNVNSDINIKIGYGLSRIHFLNIVMYIIKFL